MSTSITLSNDPRVDFNTFISQDPTDPYEPPYQYDYVVAGTGNDTVQTDIGAVTVVGSSGVLTFIDDAAPHYYNLGTDSVTGGAGSLIVQSGPFGGTFVGGANGGNVFVSNVIAGATDTMTGVSEGDRFFGSNGSNSSTGAGNDVMNLGAGREIVVAGSGPTTVNGGTGSSAIFAGSGTDYVNAGTGGADTVVGGSGTVNVLSSYGAAVFGGSGNTFVVGAQLGNDSIIGGSGTLGYQGRGANLLISAGSGDNKIETGNGAALVFAGSGNLTLTGGGGGGLQLVLGSGTASITETGATSLYDLVKGDSGGSTVITGFKVGIDKIDLFGYNASDAKIVSSGGSSVISFSDGTKITLAGVATVGGGVFA